MPSRTLRPLWLAAVLCFSACPTSPSTDGGAGGGSATGGGGGAVGGGTAGGVGGGAAGGVGGGGGGAVGGGAAGGVGGGTAGGVGGGTAGGAGGGAAGLPVAQFCAAATSARCDWLQACGRVLSTERAECERFFLPACQQLMTRAMHGVPGYDPIQGAACVAGFATHPCGVFYSAYPFTACAGLPVTTVSPPDSGYPCAKDTNAGYCPANLGYCAGLGAACGVCTPYSTSLADGTPCDAMAQHCKSTSWCAFQTDGGVDRCAPLIPNLQPALGNDSCAGGIVSLDLDGGAICGYFPTGHACSLYSGCKPQDYCMGVSAFPLTNGTCVARSALGQSCVNQEYDDGCQNSTCLDGVCQLAINSRDAGTECESYQQCKSGEHCVFDGGTQRLRAGVCAPRLQPPAACLDVQDCVSSAACVAGHCQTLGGPSDTCSTTVQVSCRLLLDCLSPNDGGPARCQTMPRIGEPCPAFRCVNLDGGRAACTTDGGNPPACTDPSPVGAACSTTSQCASSRCESTTLTDPPSCQLTCWP